MRAGNPDHQHHLLATGVWKFGGGAPIGSA
jgi:hypothetical protein